MGLLSGSDDVEAKAKRMRRSQSSKDLREEDSRQREKFGVP